MSLRELVASATPGTWEVITSPSGNPMLVAHGERWTTDLYLRGPDGRLIALAPEMAVLLADVMEYVDVIGAYLSSQSDPSPAVAQAEELLARFRRLDARAGGEET